jgi:G3E family GTPase
MEMSNDELELIPDLVIDETDEIRYTEVKKQPKDLSGAIIEEDKNKRVPITILTGYLGSGKSTLLDQIAKRGDRKLAVILNEFGDSIDIEKSLTVKDKDNNEIEEWLDLGNGCLCCTVKDNGVAAIERLVAKKKGFDHIILETTGLADPGPIITMFWLDDGLLSNVYIDGVITVLDANNIEKNLDDKDNSIHDHHEHKHGEECNKLTVAHVQIALADVILLNKIDTIENDAQKRRRVEDRIRNINGNVPIYETKFGDISLDKILDLHAYEAKDINELVKTINVETNVHDHRMGTVTFNFRKLKDLNEFSKFEKFLQDLLWDDSIDENDEKAMEIHRIKGLIFVGDSYKVVQGVRKTYDLIDGEQEISKIDLIESRIVIIGKFIDSQIIRLKFENALGFVIN